MYVHYAIAEDALQTQYVRVMTAAGRLLLSVWVDSGGPANAKPFGFSHGAWPFRGRHWTHVGFCSRCGGWYSQWCACYMGPFSCRY